MWALGIKLLVWQILMGAQLGLPVISGFLVKQGLPIPAAGLELLTQLILFLMLPQVMIHMVMPVTTRGWLMHYQFKGWKKSFGACAYWCGIVFVVTLPAMVPAGIAGAIGYRGIIQFSADMTHNYTANAALGADLEVFYAARNNPKKDVALPPEPKSDDRKYEKQKIAWKGIIVPAIGIAMSQLLFGFSAVFAMRANGLFGRYFKST